MKAIKQYTLELHRKRNREQAERKYEESSQIILYYIKIASVLKTNQ